MNNLKRLSIVMILLALPVLACSGQEVLFVSTPTSPPPSTSPPVVIATATPLMDEDIAEVEAIDALLVNLYQRTNLAVVYVEVSADMGLTSEPFGSGSGFVIDRDGHIVTNNHVVESADTVKVTFENGTVREAEVVGQDPYSDLAVLQVDAASDLLTPLELGDSDMLKVGQRVVAIGNPFGLEGTMTVGVVSALGRTLPAQVAQDAGVFSNPEIVQTDASINPGNSGGPLLDLRGRVIGVNTAIRSTTGVNAGVGFAVPVNTVKRIIPHLIEEGYYNYPYMGITSDNRFTVAELAEELDLPVKRGVLISEVQPDTAAERAGLRGGDREVEVMGATILAGGDIIIAIDGYDLQNFDDLISYLVGKTKVGQEVTLTIVRDGKEMDIPVTLGERP
jgi:S1-C subfamily serine protease